MTNPSQTMDGTLKKDLSLRKRCEALLHLADVLHPLNSLGEGEAKFFTAGNTSSCAPTSSPDRQPLFPYPVHCYCFFHR